MTTILQLKNLYAQAFEKLKAFQIILFKTFAFLVVGLIAAGIFAFIFRVATGFFVI
jgi:hypothetical protein